MRKGGPLALLILLTSCTATPLPVPAVSLEASATPPISESPTPSPSPPTSAAPSQAATPEPTLALPAGGIEGFALGTLSGALALTLVAPVPLTHEFELGEIWAVPLDGRPARLSARFVSNAPGVSGIGTSPGRTQNVLARQLSPDGRELLLSVATPRHTGGWRLSLIIVELESGRTRMVGSDDSDHDRSGAWSPDGKRIAYVRRPDVRASGAFDDGLWVMAADGSAPRRVIPHGFGTFTSLISWASDSRTVAFAYSFEDSFMETVDVDSGARGRFGFTTSQHAFSWRTARPSFVGVLHDSPRGNEHAIFVADDPLGPPRELFRDPDTSAFLYSPRWHPTRDEIMFGRGPDAYALEIGGQPRRLAALGPLVGNLEWTPAGDGIVFSVLERPESQRRGTLNLVSLDGSAPRQLFASPSGSRITDSVIRSY